MELFSYESGPLQTNGYILYEQGKAWAIDTPPWSHEIISGFLREKKLKLETILLTHSHWDHIADCALLQKEQQCSVMIHRADLENLERPGSDGMPCWLSFAGVEPDRFLEEGEEIVLGSAHLVVIHTPGHTPGGICLYSKDLKMLFSGDTLFRQSIGNLSLPTGHAADMWPSLEKLAKLPPETVVYPGHGPTTTIGAEEWLGRAKEIFGR